MSPPAFCKDELAREGYFVPSGEFSEGLWGEGGLSSDQLRIFWKLVDRYPVGLVDRPAKLLESGTGSKCCFEVSVPRGPDGLLVFRYVSEPESVSMG